MTDNKLHTKYRPKKWADVVGQATVVKAMSRMVENKESQCYLLCGPSGTGKTTLARIASYAMGCQTKDIMDIDAATHTGVDEMRNVQDACRYKPFGKSSMRTVIIDECHSLSKNAWQSLLKITEEPPAHVVFFFCTTEPAKVPATIKTRSSAFTLKEVEDTVLGGLFDTICEKEKLDLPGDVGDMVIREAHGSPRQMLVNLAMCKDCKTKKEAAELLRAAIQSDAIIELCRFLMKGGSWLKAMAIFSKLSDENPESVRIVVCNYMASVLIGSKGDDESARVLNMLEAFSTPYNPSERAAPLLLSIGRVLFSE